MDKYSQLKDLLDTSCKRDELLSKHTTLQIGGPAKLFLAVNNEEHLVKTIRQAEKLGVDYLVVGEGSNLLVDDRGYPGLVIGNKVEGIKIIGGRVRVKSGTKLQKYIDFAIQRGFPGVERMAGIPGTVGGAIHGNAGAYGQTISDNLARVKIFDGQRTRWLTKKRCKFDYRESVFKKRDFVILEGEFRFTKPSSSRLKREAEYIKKLRLEKYPKGMLCPGSFIKNVLIDDLSQSTLAKIPKEDILYKKIPAGYLLEMVGARGNRKGKIKIAGYHGNLFINQGGGKASDFYYLAKKYQRKVKEKFGIDLEPEVQLIGLDKLVSRLST